MVQCTDGQDRKNPPEELPQIMSSTVVDPAAIARMQEMRMSILPHYDHLWGDKPCWCLEASQEQRQTTLKTKQLVKDHFSNIGIYDCPDKERDLTHRPEDHIHTVDLLPKD